MTDLTAEILRRLRRGSIDAIDGLDHGSQEGYIRLEPHSGAYSIGTGEQFWGGFLLGRGWLLATVLDDLTLRDRLIARVPYVTKLSRFANVDTGFSGYYGLALGYQATGDESMKASALQAAESVARLFNEDVGLFLTRPSGAVDPGFDELPFSDVFCPRELLVDTGAILDLLWWASAFEPRYLDMLITHSRRALEVGIVEPDGQAHHCLDFTDAGAPIHLHTHQGYQPGSRWTRAQAWASLGYATAFLATRDEQFRAAAVASIGRMLADLDGRVVGPYDFDDPDAAAPEDSCSSMITATAILRLAHAGAAPTPDAEAFVDAVLETALARYLTPGGTVLHGCWGTLGARPREAVMPYGNYFLAEAALRRHDPSLDLWGLSTERSFA